MIDLRAHRVVAVFAERTFDAWHQDADPPWYLYDDMTREERFRAICFLRSWNEFQDRPAARRPS